MPTIHAGVPSLGVDLVANHFSFLGAPLLCEMNLLRTAAATTLRVQVFEDACGAGPPFIAGVGLPTDPDALRHTCLTPLSLAGGRSPSETSLPIKQMRDARFLPAKATFLLSPYARLIRVFVRNKGAFPFLARRNLFLQRCKS